MDYTDNQLKAALAKMLPDKLKLVPYGREDNLILSWILQKSSEPVRDTELLHLCVMVEDRLEPLSEEYYFERISKRFNWQQRVVALAKVKGIEI